MYYNEGKKYESINDYIDGDDYEDEEFTKGLSFDDFDFNSIPSKMMDRAEELYISEQSMNDMYDAFVTYESLCRMNPNQIPMLNGEWSFPNSGVYKGIITECERSKKSQFDFILKILINSKDIKYIKFTHSNMNCIYKSIRDLACKDDEYFDTSYLIGRVVVLDIQNKRFHGNGVFSNVNCFEILNDKEEEILIEMIKIMLKYYDSQYE